VTDVRDLQAEIKRVRAERGFMNDPVRLLCLLTEELGEVAAEIKKTWSDNYPDLAIDDLASEISDVYVGLSALASAFDIDLEDAVRSKFFGSDASRQWHSASPSTGETPNQ